MKIMVSSCLLGQKCKYNGGDNLCQKVIDFTAEHEVIPVCPEVAGGLSVPRPPCEMVNGRIVNTDGEDRSREFRDGAEKCLALAQKHPTDLAILQSRSPSCGVKQIYDGTFSRRLINGSGVFASLLSENGFRVIDAEEMTGNDNIRLINISQLSVRYHVRSLHYSDIPEILALCSKNPLYYRHCPPFVTEQSILDDMKALPPDKEYSDKYYIGYFDGEKLIAVMDLIMAYPDHNRCLIGFFMTDVSLQNAGVGSSIIHELFAYLKSIGLSGIRLGWVDSNPQAKHFWQKNGFKETGMTYETDHYTVTVAERLLISPQENESVKERRGM